jgi:hypothetical protein
MIYVDQSSPPDKIARDLGGRTGIVMASTLAARGAGLQTFIIDVMEEPECLTE